jgi:hypothetical protein
VSSGSASTLNYPIVAEDDVGHAVGLGWVRIEPTHLSTATLFQLCIIPTLGTKP